MTGLTIETSAATIPRDTNDIVEAFALLEYLLEAAGIRLDPTVNPFLFEMRPTGGTWLFDPRSPGALFRRLESAPTTALSKLTCSPALMVRLLTSPSFSLDDDDELTVEGSIDDLVPIARALEGVTTMLGIRCQQRTKRKIRR